MFNNEYRQFVYWVRDSIARRILGAEFPEDFMIPTFDDELEQKDLFNLAAERSEYPVKGELIDKLSDDIRHRFGNKMIARGKSLGSDSAGNSGEK